MKVVLCVLLVLGLVLGQNISLPLPANGMLSGQVVDGTITQGLLVLDTFGVFLNFDVSGTVNVTSEDVDVTGVLSADQDLTESENDGVTITLLAGGSVVYTKVGFGVTGGFSGPVRVNEVDFDSIEMTFPEELNNPSDYEFTIRDEETAIDLDSFIDGVPGGLLVKNVSITVGVNITYCFAISISETDYTGGVPSELSTIAQYVEFPSDLLSICGAFNTGNPGTGTIDNVQLPLGITLQDVTYSFQLGGVSFTGRVILPHPILTEDLVMDSTGLFGKSDVTITGSQSGISTVSIKELEKAGFSSAELSNLELDITVKNETSVQGSLTSQLTWQDICFDLTVSFPEFGSASLCDDQENPTLQDIADGLPALEISGVLLEFEGDKPYLSFTVDFADNAALSDLSDFIGVDLSVPVRSAIETGEIDLDALLVSLDTDGVWFDDIVDSDCSMDMGQDPALMDCVLEFILPSFEDRLTVPFVAELIGEGLVFNSLPTDPQSVTSSFFDGSELEFSKIESTLNWDPESNSFTGDMASEVRNTVLGTEFCISFDAVLPAEDIEDLDFLDQCKAGLATLMTTLLVLALL